MAYVTRLAERGNLDASGGNVHEHHDEVLKSHKPASFWTQHFPTTLVAPRSILFLTRWLFAFRIPETVQGTAQVAFVCNIQHVRDTSVCLGTNLMSVDKDLSVAMMTSSALM